MTTKQENFMEITGHSKGKWGPHVPVKNNKVELDPAVVNEMKYFISSTKNIDEKYKCRTVRALFAIAEWCEQPRSAKLAAWCKDVAMKKIHAPICSIGKEAPKTDSFKPSWIYTPRDIEEAKKEETKKVMTDLLKIVEGK